MGLRNFCSVILLGLAMWAIPSFADDATTPADKGPVLQVAVIDSEKKFTYICVHHGHAEKHAKDIVFDKYHLDRG